MNVIARYPPGHVVVCEHEGRYYQACFLPEQQMVWCNVGNLLPHAHSPMVAWPSAVLRTSVPMTPEVWAIMSANPDALFAEMIL